jgi:hypothetical protein
MAYATASLKVDRIAVILVSSENRAKGYGGWCIIIGSVPTIIYACT